MSEGWRWAAARWRGIEGRGARVHAMRQRPEGFERDCRKYGEAALRGWKLLRFTRAMIESGEALAMIVRGLGE